MKHKHTAHIAIFVTGVVEVEIDARAVDDLHVTWDSKLTDSRVSSMILPGVPATITSDKKVLDETIVALGARSLMESFMLQIKAKLDSTPQAVPDVAPLPPSGASA